MSVLSDLKICKAKRKTKEFSLSDGQGLSIIIKPSRSKVRRFRFYLNGKQEKMSFGFYPAVDLKTARLLRHDAQIQLAKGIDPREERKAAQTVQNQVTFEEFALDWMKFRIKKLGLDKSDHRQSTMVQIRRYMQKDFLPVLGKKAMVDITRADVITVMRTIENRGALAIAEKCRRWLNEIFRHAFFEGLTLTNPAADFGVIAIPAPPERHNPYLKMQELPAFLEALEHYPGSEQTKLGIKLLFLTGAQ